ncbi:phosphatidylserine decarboxylase [Clostridiisalibacter paucivorans]|uniref:phosphatidylserine decarboxylase n=1 Tax=Clostridiisalibacter paucivorans TaxID=408753 RepID=UPI00047C8E76|nr:phosphatidylserine decarboxylase [Clostridiisalibacter paucivorans]
MDIYYVDRQTNEKKREIVAGNKYLKWINNTKSGNIFLEKIVKKKLFSSIYGKIQDLSISRKKIPQFIKTLNIDMSESLIEDISEFKTFNHFFTRKLKNSARPINKNKNVLISPVDGKILAYESIDIKNIIQVKGSSYKLSELFLDSTMAKRYIEGHCIVIRLAPSDYHRFHFPDDGIAQNNIKIKGDYYSVNPLTLNNISNVYCKNKRELTIFNSHNFDEIVMVEVGATCVGSIIQTYTPGKSVYKGDEKGFFKFGGSTVIMFLKKNVIAIDDDILENTSKGLETKIHMGERIAIKKPN